MKKAPRGVIIYTSVPEMTIINHIVPEMLTETDRFSLSSSAIFCPFTPLTAQKNENIKKMKKNTWKYHHFTLV